MISHRPTGYSRTPVRTLVACTLMAASAMAFAKTELTVAHQLNDHHARELEKLVNRFVQTWIR